jgi:flagellar biosynthesis protein FlhF
MRVKKFTAESLRSATEQMKSELGSEAIVLSTRTVPRGGLFSFASKNMVEITAAIDDVPLRRAQAAAPAPLHGPGAYAAQAAGTVRSAPAHAERPAVEPVRQEMRRTEDPAATADFRLLRSEVDGLRSTLSEIAGYIRHNRMPSLPTALADLYATLAANGLDTDLAGAIVQTVYRQSTDADMDDAPTLTGRVIDELAQAFRVAPSVQAAGRRVVVLVGPTGVGKTTTIAKLAALSKLVDGSAIGLISADTYRIGAIEQLRTFAGIADMPMDVAYEPADVTAALERFSDRDVVFIDTVGRNQRGADDLAELKRFLDAARADEVHLVLSATTGIRTQLDVAARFRTLQPNRLLFTKLDETASAGTLARVARETGLPLSYVTTGQAVPDDLHRADARRLATMIVSGEWPHA